MMTLNELILFITILLILFICLLKVPPQSYEELKEVLKYTSQMKMSVLLISSHRFSRARRNLLPDNRGGE